MLNVAEYLAALRIRVSRVYVRVSVVVDFSTTLAITSEVTTLWQDRNVCIVVTISNCFMLLTAEQYRCVSNNDSVERENSPLSAFVFSDFSSSAGVGLLRHKSSGRFRHQWLHSSEVKVLWQFAVGGHGWLSTPCVPQPWRGVCHYYAVCTLQRRVHRSYAILIQFD